MKDTKENRAKEEIVELEKILFSILKVTEETHRKTIGTATITQDEPDAVRSDFPLLRNGEENKEGKDLFKVIISVFKTYLLSLIFFLKIN